MMCYNADKHKSSGYSVTVILRNEVTKNLIIFHKRSFAYAQDDTRD